MRVSCESDVKCFGCKPKMAKWHAIHSTFSFKLKLFLCAENDFNGCPFNIRYSTP